jgi:hypothetical protein
MNLRPANQNASERRLGGLIVKPTAASEHKKPAPLCGERARVVSNCLQPKKKATPIRSHMTIVERMTAMDSMKGFMG